MMLSERMIDELKWYLKTAEKFRGKELTREAMDSLVNIYDKYIKGKIFPDKTTLRKSYLEKRNLLSDLVIDEYSRKISERLFASQDYKKADVLFVYLSFGKEFRTNYIIERAFVDHKKVCVPLVREKRMVLSFIDTTTVYKQGHFGIREPETIVPCCKEEVDFAIVPGLMFTSTGYRVGYGGGYYDKFLSDFNGIMAGLVMPGFIDESFIPDEYDIPVDYLITSEES